MCRIRVIFKNEDKSIIKDEVYQFDSLVISPVDRPSYVTCSIEGEKKTICSYFINNSEQFCEIKVDAKMEFSYGKLSGRIDKLITSYLQLYDTTRFRCKQSIPDDLSVRASNNLNEYLRLYGFILEKLENSLVYKSETPTQEDVIEK